MSFKLQNFGLQQNRFKQFINTHTCVRRHRDKRYSTAPIFRQYVTGRQFALHTLRIGGFFIHFVDGNHDWHACRFRVLNGFFGLRHHTIVSSNHQDHHVSGLSTTGTHGGKRGVSRSIQEGHHAMIGFYVVSTDVLGNTTGFTGYHAGTTDIVEQRGFTMVNVTHYGNHRCTWLLITLVRNGFGNGYFQRVIGNQLGHFVTHFFNHQSGCILIQNLVDGRHHTHFHQGFNHFTSFYGHFRCQIGNGNGFRQFNFMNHGRCRTGKGVFIGRLLTATATFSLAFATTTGTVTVIVTTIGKAAVLTLINAFFVDCFVRLFAIFFLTRLSGFSFCTFLRSVFFHRGRLGFGGRFGAGRCRFFGGWCFCFCFYFSNGFCRCFCDGRCCYSFSSYLSGGFCTSSFFFGFFSFQIQLFAFYIRAFFTNFNGDGFFATLTRFQGRGHFTLKRNFVRRSRCFTMAFLQKKQQRLFLIIRNRLTGCGLWQPRFFHLGQ